MKILALDSSGLVASVAVMEDDNLIAEYTMNHKKTHSQTLVPMRSMVELDLSTIDALLWQQDQVRLPDSESVERQRRA